MQEKFRPGMKVKYVGDYTPFLRNMVGYVLDPPTTSTETIRVDWSGLGKDTSHYYGVYPHNLEIISTKPKWRV